MKRLLLAMLTALALPTVVNANWFGGKLLYLICDTSAFKIYSDWKEVNKNDYGLFTLNEKERTASLSKFNKKGIEIHSSLDVELFSEGLIKLSRKYKYNGEDNIVNYTINRINGDFNFSYGPNLIFRGKCRKSDRKSRNLF